jgi:hypothetical protein
MNVDEVISLRVRADHVKPSSSSSLSRGHARQATFDKSKLDHPGTEVDRGRTERRRGGAEANSA